VAASHLLAPHRNRWIRILGVAFVMYILSYIDRTNIAMAIPAMRSQMGISASAIGFATGTFFWGYLILQIPAGRLAAVWSAKWVIFGLLMFWSIVSCSTAFVHTENELIANRFMLGIFEGGVLTCTIVLIRKWFTRAERARANTMFLVSIPVASVVANPISGRHAALQAAGQAALNNEAAEDLETFDIRQPAAACARGSTIVPISSSASIAGWKRSGST